MQRRADINVYEAAHDGERVAIVTGVPMNTCIQVVGWEIHERVPDGDHTLDPKMLKGPNTDLSKEHIGADRLTNPKESSVTLSGNPFLNSSRRAYRSLAIASALHVEEGKNTRGTKPHTHTSRQACGEYVGA
jgi:hypothetical protein